MQQQPNNNNVSNNNNVYPVMTLSPTAPPPYPYPQNLQQPPAGLGYAFYPQSVPQTTQIPQRPAVYPPGYAPNSVGYILSQQPHPNNVGYIPSQQPQSQPQPQHSTYDKLEELPIDNHPSPNGNVPSGPVILVTPFGLENGSISEEILAQDYQVSISKWYSDSWCVYKQHWIAFCIPILIQIVVTAFLPHAGPMLVFPLSLGIFIAVSHKIRHNGLMGEMKYDHLLYGYLYYLPMLLIGALSFVAIFTGLFLCIIPGIYAMIALTFSVPIFLEYHERQIGFIGSMLLSLKVINKHFVEMTLFLVLNLLFGLSGILLLGVGALVTFPMSQIVLVMAFKDLFGLNPHKTPQVRLVVCN